MVGMSNNRGYLCPRNREISKTDVKSPQNVEVIQEREIRLRTGLYKNI